MGECCGKAGASRNVPRERAGRETSVELTYVGGTALTVVGPASGVRYRFDRPGARVRVDARDVAPLLAIGRLARAR